TSTRACSASRTRRSSRPIGSDRAVRWPASGRGQTSDRRAYAALDARVDRRRHQTTTAIAMIRRSTSSSHRRLRSPAAVEELDGVAEADVVAAGAVAGGGAIGGVEVLAGASVPVVMLNGAEASKVGVLPSSRIPTA